MNSLSEKQETLIQKRHNVTSCKNVTLSVRQTNTHCYNINKQFKKIKINTFLDQVKIYILKITILTGVNLNLFLLVI